ncbi:MAG: hypothetical protein GX800_04875 [Clostridiaceae bacterium]|nr:hypothetical protein [Clostridiaceae bacterium]
MAIKYIDQPLPRIEKVPFSVNSWRGLNRITGTQVMGDMAEAYNMSSDNVPFASPRQSREVISTVTNPQNLFSAGDKLGYIANGNLYYDGEVVKDSDDNDALVGETSSIVDFNGNVVMYPSNAVYDYVDNEFEEITNTLSKTDKYYKRDGTESTVESTDSVAFHSYIETDHAAMFHLGTLSTPNNETVVINASNLAALDSNVYRKLFIVASGTDGVIAPRRYYDYHVKSIGNPFTITGATSLKIMVGYYNSHGNPVTEPKVADLANATFWAVISGSEGSGYPATGTIPVIQYATVDNNRIFAAQGNNIYASSQGEYDDWTDFVDTYDNPNPLGSYAEELDTPQDITGIIKYRGNVVIFKPDLVYESYGNKPPYRIIEVAKTGCIDGRSVVEVNSVLYWLGRKGIYAYTGGQPTIISEQLDKTFESGVAGTDGRKYYISAYDGEKWTLYVYDTFTGLWHIEDDTQFIGFAMAGGEMYGLAKSGSLYKFNSGTERVKWEFETQAYTFGIPNTKTLSKIYVRVQMAPYTDLDVYIKKDNSDFERRATYHANEYTVFDFKAKVKKFDSLTLKFKGIGDVRILDVHGDVILGTAKHKKGDLSVFRR